jgi:hypothetical protein
VTISLASKKRKKGDKTPQNGGHEDFDDTNHNFAAPGSSAARRDPCLRRCVATWMWCAVGTRHVVVEARPSGFSWEWKEHFAHEHAVGPICFRERVVGIRGRGEQTCTKGRADFLCSMV